VDVLSAERGGHHGHPAARTDRRAVVVIHSLSIPDSGDSNIPPAGPHSPRPVFRNDP
jgi:hypothetical protein